MTSLEQPEVSACTNNDLIAVKVYLWLKIRKGSLFKYNLIIFKVKAAAAFQMRGQHWSFLTISSTKKTQLVTSKTELKMC